MQLYSLAEKLTFLILINTSSCKCKSFKLIYSVYMWFCRSDKTVLITTSVYAWTYDNKATYPHRAVGDIENPSTIFFLLPRTLVYSCTCHTVCCCCVLAGCGWRRRLGRKAGRKEGRGEQPLRSQMNAFSVFKVSYPNAFYTARWPLHFCLHCLVGIH